MGNTHHKQTKQLPLTLPFCQGVVLTFSFSFLQNSLKSRLCVLSPKTFYPSCAVTCLCLHHFTENALSKDSHRLLDAKFSSVFILDEKSLDATNHCLLEQFPGSCKTTLRDVPLCLWASSPFPLWLPLLLPSVIF